MKITEIELLERLLSGNHPSPEDLKTLRIVEVKSRDGSNLFQIFQLLETSHIEHLDLSSNGLESLPENLFHGFKDLWCLRLACNRISVLPQGLFRGLAKLSQLALYNNKIFSLPEGIFDDLGALWSLGLSGNNISALPEGIFRNSVALNHLDLSHNRLLDFSESTYNDLHGSLKFLHLEGNEIMVFPEISYKNKSLNLFNGENFALQKSGALVYDRSYGHPSGDQVYQRLMSYYNKGCADFWDLLDLTLDGHDGKIFCDWEHKLSPEQKKKISELRQEQYSSLEGFDAPDEVRALIFSFTCYISSSEAIKLSSNPVIDEGEDIILGCSSDIKKSRFS